MGMVSGLHCTIPDGTSAPGKILPPPGVQVHVWTRLARLSAAGVLVTVLIARPGGRREAGTRRAESSASGGGVGAPRVQKDAGSLDGGRHQGLEAQRFVTPVAAGVRGAAVVTPGAVEVGSRTACRQRRHSHNRESTRTAEDRRGQTGNGWA